jgi:hypothetical protein
MTFRLKHQVQIGLTQKYIITMYALEGGTQMKSDPKAGSHLTYFWFSLVPTRGFPARCDVSDDLYLHSRSNVCASNTVGLPAILAKAAANFVQATSINSQILTYSIITIILPTHLKVKDEAIHVGYGLRVPPPLHIFKTIGCSSVKLGLSPSETNVDSIRLRARYWCVYHTQRSGNRIYFRPQVMGGKTPSMADPIQRANLNHWIHWTDWNLLFLRDLAE